MFCRHSRCAVALVLSVAPMISGVRADDMKYPDLKGQWSWVVMAPGPPAFDPTKTAGKGQQAPLTPEYQAIFEKSVADQARGGQGSNFDYARCVAGGMPHMMAGYQPFEFIVTPETTYIIIADQDHLRRIFTDGRDWPKEIEPTYQGYSMGRWIDEDGDGRFDVLEAETRGPFKGPRDYDLTGLPLHQDNQSTFKERIYLDKTNRNILHDEITVTDHALTRPWTVDKKLARNPNPHPDWPEISCPENIEQVFVGKEMYATSADGLLMPTKKDQPPPDLRYFKVLPVGR